jgi:hypothetical protein
MKILFKLLFGVKYINRPISVLNMLVKDILDGLRATDTFKEWHSKNPEAKPVHVFLMLEPGRDVKYDVGFFDFNKELMTSFVAGDKFKDVEITESKEIFTKDAQKIMPLDEAKVKVGFKDAFDTSHALQKEKYKQHEPMKEVVILQNLDIGQVWNITYITKTFQTLNIKIDAETGKVVEDKLHQIFSMDK